MRLIDSHCHLAETIFDNDLEEVIKRAAHEKIDIITSAINPETWDKSLEISMRYPNCYMSAGLDPLLYQETSSAIEWIENHHNLIISIGEIGIDHYRVRDHADRKSQEDSFRRLITLALEFSLPMQIHSRSAGKKALEILTSLNAEKVQMHAFDGRASLARVASREQGYYFSIPTSVVRSPQKKKLVKAINIERLLLETDSPVLGAQKGVRNEPSNLTFALNEVAKILNRDVDEVRKIVVENSLRLYSRIK